MLEEDKKTYLVVWLTSLKIITILREGLKSNAKEEKLFLYKGAFKLSISLRV